MSNKHIEYSIYTQENVNSTPIKIENGTTQEQSVKSPILGSINLLQPCLTCNLTTDCPGHFGKHALPHPIFKSVYRRSIDFLSKNLCPFCGGIRNININKLLQKIENNNNIITLEHRKEFSLIKNQSKTYNKQIKTKCSNSFCQLSSSSIQYKKNSNFYFNANTVQICENQKLLTYLQNLPKNFLKLLSNVESTEIIEPKNLFYTESILIPSNYVRPPNIYENNISEPFTTDLNLLVRSFDSTGLNKTPQKIFDIIDNNQNANPYNLSGKKLNLSILTNGTHKDSLLRSCINGKRVPNTARGVIGPGNLKIGEISIPKETLNILPESIYYNYITEKYINQELKKTPENRNIQFKTYIKEDHLSNSKPYQIIPMDDNHKIMIPNHGDSFEVPKQTNDYIASMRAPSLHKFNFQSARITEDKEENPDGKERTINIPPPVTPSYNADFDGDEKTIKNFQNPTSNIEQGLIMNSRKLLKHPLTGTTMFGFVQDQIVAANLLLQETSLSIENTYLILGEYIYLLDTLKIQKTYSGRDIISCIFPSYFTLPNIFINGRIIVSNIMTTMVSANSYYSIFNGLSQYYNEQYTIYIIDIFKTIVQNYIQYFGLSIKIRDIVPNDKIIDNIQQFVHTNVNKINKNLNQLVQNLVNKKTFISHYDEISDLKMKNITEFNKKTQQYLINLLEKEYTHSDNQFKKCFDMNYKLNIADVRAILVYSGQKYTKDLPVPAINGKTSLYGLKNNINLEDSGFVPNSFINGITYGDCVHTSKAEAFKQVVNVTAGTSSAGFIGKKMVKMLSLALIGYDKFLVTNKYILNCNPNFLKISPKDMARVDIILPHKKMIWYNEISDIFNQHLKKYIIQKNLSKNLEVISEVDFYVNLVSEIMTYYYEAKNLKKKYVIHHEQNKQKIYDFYNLIEEQYYFKLNDLSYILYVFLIYFDPSGLIFSDYESDVSNYFSDELLTIIFNKIIDKLRYSLSPGYAMGYDIANTIQEKFTQQSLSSFHTTTKAGSNVQRGATEEFRQLIELSKKDKEDIVTCYDYDKTKLDIIKNYFEYISLLTICNKIDIIETKESENTAIYNCEINLPILYQKNIDFSTLYAMFKIYCERCFIIQEYSLLIKCSDNDPNILNIYIYVQFKLQHKNNTFNFDILTKYLKVSFLDGVHKGKQINTNLFIDQIESQCFKEDIIEKTTLYELKFFIESLHDLKYIDTANLEAIHLPAWLDFSIGGIEYMKNNITGKALLLLNEPHFTHCITNFFRLRFAGAKPANIKTLYDKSEIIKQANHGNSTIIADAAYENISENCHDIYSSLLVSQKPQLGTGYYSFVINPNKYDQIQNLYEETKYFNKNNNIISIL